VETEAGFRRRQLQHLAELAPNAPDMGSLVRYSVPTLAASKTAHQRPRCLLTSSFPSRKLEARDVRSARRYWTSWEAIGGTNTRRVRRALGALLW
jgi:hypothetical protein